MVGIGDVGDGGADDRLFRRHVLEGFCRADEARGFVSREGKQTHIPSGEIFGKLLVTALSEEMKIGAARSRKRDNARVSLEVARYRAARPGVRS